MQIKEKLRKLLVWCGLPARASKCFAIITVHRLMLQLVQGITELVGRTENKVKSGTEPWNKRTTTI